MLLVYRHVLISYALSQLLPLTSSTSLTFVLHHTQVTTCTFGFIPSYSHSPRLPHARSIQHFQSGHTSLFFLLFSSLLFSSVLFSLFSLLSLLSLLAFFFSFIVFFSSSL